MDTPTPSSSTQSFLDGTHKLPVNRRTAAIKQAEDGARTTSLPPNTGGHQHATLFKLKAYWDRERLPDPAILSRIDVTTLGTRQAEIDKLKRMAMTTEAPGNTHQTPPSSALQEQVYRVLLANLKPILDLR